MSDGTDETTEPIISLIDALGKEITIRQTMLAGEMDYTAFTDCFKKTDKAFTPNDIVVLNFTDFL